MFQNYGGWGQWAYSEGHNLRLVRLNWDEIVRDDGQLVLVDAEFLNGLGTSIDQPQAMLLPRSKMKFGKASVVRTWRSIGNERAIVIHLPIDQIVVRFWRYLCKIRTRYIFYDLIVRLVIIVRQKYRAQINVIVCASRPVDYHRSKKTSGVLGAVMRMVPGRAVQVRFEAICQALTGSDWALRDGWHAIFPGGASLE